MNVFGLRMKSDNNTLMKDNLLRFNCAHAQDLNDWEVADYLKDHIHFWFTFGSSHIWLVESKEDALDALLKFPEYAEDADGNFERPCFHNPTGGHEYGAIGIEKINHEEVEVVELTINLEKQNETDIPLELFLNKEDKAQNIISPLGIQNRWFDFGDFDPDEHNWDYSGSEGVPALPTLEDLVKLSENRAYIFVGNYDLSKIDPELIEKYEKTEVFISEVQ